MQQFLKKFWWLSIPVLLGLAVIGFLVWANTPLGPMPEALASLDSDPQVQVSGDDWYAFKPAITQPTTGFIFYPGGRVDPRSYAPAARDLAGRGYLVVIAPMPLNLAVFDPGRAAQVMQAYPFVRAWAVGGHSLGGAMAANFARSNPEQVRGLVLWASYPASSDDLSAANLAVVSIYGLLDGLATLDKIEASRPLLPPDTRWVALTGGNHAQFGWYGAQPGDLTAQIDRRQQQILIIEATAALLEEISP